MPGEIRIRIFQIDILFYAVFQLDRNGKYEPSISRSGFDGKSINPFDETTREGAPWLGQPATHLDGNPAPLAVKVISGLESL